MKRRKIIGGIIVVIGIALILYPIIRQAYSAHRQDELKDAFQELLEENQKNAAIQGENQGNVSLNEDPTATPDVQGNQNPDEQQAPNGASDSQGNDLALQEENENLALEELDENKDSQTPTNIKNRLKGQTVLGLVEIEKIDLIYAIVEGTKDSNLGVAIGHMTNTAAIGEDGNCVLAGHRGGTSGPYFKHLDQLGVGDTVKLTDVYGNIYTYSVTESFIVEPDEVWVAENTNSEKMLTLITCQNSGTKRLIVRAVCN